MTEEEALRLFERCSNAGRWGPDDELGTCNYITEEKRRRALGLARRGDVVSLGKDLILSGSRQTPPSAIRVMMYAGAESISAQDMVLLAPHGFETTHVDALAHSSFGGWIYNRRRASAAVGGRGVTFGSITAVKGGIVTRGVLLDVAAARGVPHLRRGEGVGIADLQAAERMAGVTVESGDAIFVRTGLDLREREEGVDDEVREGLLSEVIPWLHQREIAVYSGDCIEQMPSGFDQLPMPLHQIGLAAMGLYILDFPDVERLKEACAAHGRREFLLVAAPLRIPGGTGSPVNPLAIF